MLAAIVTLSDIEGKHIELVMETDLSRADSELQYVFNVEEKKFDNGNCNLVGSVKVLLSCVCKRS